MVSETNNYRLTSSHCPIWNIKIFTNSWLSAKNRMALEIRAEFCTVDSIAHIQSFIRTRFLHLNCVLQMQKDESSQMDVPAVIQIPEYLEGRAVVNNLFVHGEMTEWERQKIEQAILYLEKTGTLAMNSAYKRNSSKTPFEIGSVP